MIASARAAPILLSVICPGLGQIAQRRWFAGLSFGLGFLFFFFLLLARVAGMMWRNVQVLLDAAAGKPIEEFSQPRLATFLIPFAWAMLIFVVNLMDVTRAARAARTQRTPPSQGGSDHGTA